MRVRMPMWMRKRNRAPFFFFSSSLLMHLNAGTRQPSSVSMACPHGRNCEAQSCRRAGKKKKAGTLTGIPRLDPRGGGAL